MNNRLERKSKRLEVLLWSIALPGFGQLLNRKYIKGILLVILEFTVNVLGNLNQAIVLSFHGQIQEAMNQTNYLWFMFYPCLYFFAIWDAYKDAGGGQKPFAYLPFVFSAYIVTVGVVFSPILRISGYLIGPVWMSIISIPIGIIIGLLIRWGLIRLFKRENGK